MKILKVLPAALLGTALAVGAGEAIAKPGNGGGKGPGGGQHASSATQHGSGGARAAAGTRDPIDSAGPEDAETNDGARSGKARAAATGDPVDSAGPEDAETNDGARKAGVAASDGEDNGGVDPDNIQQGDQTGADKGQASGRRYVFKR